MNSFFTNITNVDEVVRILDLNQTVEDFRDLSKSFWIEQFQNNPMTATLDIFTSHSVNLPTLPKINKEASNRKRNRTSFNNNNKDETNSSNNSNNSNNKRSASYYFVKRKFSMSQIKVKHLMLNIVF